MQATDITSREKEVLELVAQEHTTHEIASLLYLSSHTIASHKKNIKYKLNAKNTAGMVRRGFELGILRSLAKHTILPLLLLIMTIGSISVSAQNEIELRTDGIVVPRTAPYQVTNPTEGQVVYDNDEYGELMYYNGTEWRRLFTPAFEERSGLILQTLENGPLNQSFVFGNSSLINNLNFANDTLFFFDRSIGAFGGGIYRQIREESFDDTDSQRNLKSNGVFGIGSFSYGFNTVASGNYATAIGRNNTASGFSSTALGQDNIASGFSSTALGQDNTASGSYSTALGLQSEASGNHAISLGNNTLASGESSTSFGHYTEASGFSSIASGDNSQAKGSGCNALGLGIIANSRYSTVVGTFNDTLVVTNSNAIDRPLFVVGNGSASTSQGSLVIDRNNALVVRRLGNVGINVDSAVAKLEVATNSKRSSPTLELHQTNEGGADSFVRQAFSNHSSDEKWFVVASPHDTPSDGRLNFYHTDGTGGVDALKLFGDGDATIGRDLTVEGSGTSVFKKSLKVDGDLTVDGIFTNPSDIHYKKDIISLGGTLSSISKLGGYRYNWKDENKPEPQIGLIAQEVQAVYPELVKENEEGMLSVNYTKMVPVLLEAIKEQQQLIDALESRIEKLENQ